MEFRLQLALPIDASGIPVARRLLGASLRAVGVGASCAEDLELALAEACSNVLRHAGAVDRFGVSATVIDAQCVIEVSDDGAGFDPAASIRPLDLDSEHGRGLPLMRALLDQLEFTPVPAGGTIARLTKRLEWPADLPLPDVRSGPEPVGGGEPTVQSGGRDRAGNEAVVDLEAVQRRLDAASPGPWARHGCDVHAPGPGALLRGLDGSSQAREQADCDAEFVAHARKDVDALLRALAAARRRR